MTTPFQFKVGDAVRVHFPDEPRAVDAGKTVTAKIDSVRHSEYPYAVTWVREGRELRRLCRSDWLERRTVSAGQLSLLEIGGVP